MEQERPLRRGYPWWAWVVGALMIFPLAPMLVGATIPSTRRYLGIAGISVSTVSIVLVIGIIGAVSGSEPSVEPSPTTRAPMAAPTPTLTCGTVADVAYLQQLHGSLKGTINAAADLEILNKQLESDVSVIFDESWRLQTSVAVGSLLFYSEEIAMLQPSPSLATVHSDALQMATELRAVALSYARGIDAYDGDLLVQSAMHTLNATALVQSLGSKVDAYCP